MPLDLNLHVRLSFQIMKQRTWRQRFLEWPWTPWRAVVWKEATGGELTAMIDKLHTAVHRTQNAGPALSLNEDRHHA